MWKDPTSRVSPPCKQKFISSTFSISSGHCRYSISPVLPSGYRVKGISIVLIDIIARTLVRPMIWYLLIKQAKYCEVKYNMKGSTNEIIGDGDSRKQLGKMTI